MSQTFVSPSQQKGSYFEKLALKFLLKNKLKLIEKNFSASCGEIDLILKDREFLIFTEVRFRNSNQYGSPIESVNYSKQKKIIKTSQLFLLQNSLYEQVPCRFDVLGIINNNQKIEYHWIKNAFQLS